MRLPYLSIGDGANRTGAPCRTPCRRVVSGTRMVGLGRGLGTSPYTGSTTGVASEVGGGAWTSGSVLGYDFNARDEWRSAVSLSGWLRDQHFGAPQRREQGQVPKVAMGNGEWAHRMEAKVLHTTAITHSHPSGRASNFQGHRSRFSRECEAMGHVLASLFAGQPLVLSA